MDEKRNYRVYIAIYDDVESTKDDPVVWTDEPLYSGNGANEMAAQAHRTFQHFINKLEKLS